MKEAVIAFFLCKASLSNDALILHVFNRVDVKSKQYINRKL